ncbi:DNA-binding transcriptional ArsR family regulator [Arthrobacter pascens]|nr:DNA-binding transcriptional ArsR family regulator [Arthrobacter pascens]
MTAHAVVRSCSELSVGDHVEAQRDGRVLHRGRVLAVVPALELFWISDARTGTRQLLDLEMLSVLRCPVRAVPEAEANPVSVLLCRNGLSGKKIAELTGAPQPTVSHHLSAAWSVDRELKTDHEAAAGKPAPPSLPGIIRMHHVILMVQETGRYPSRHSDDASERKLAAWLRRRRRDARAGILAPELRDGLAVLPDWQRKPRDVAGDAIWRDQLAALVAYRLGGNDWPRRKAADTEQEYELGFWLHTQRFKLRRGKLSSEKAEELDAALPGWLAGRKRGKKAQLSLNRSTRVQCDRDETPE